jgi:16S rRNA (adenine1518-N6/adenine1519-N6)-dimethyltransferase
MTQPPSLPIAEELARRGIRPNRRLGQNFMIDRQMLDFLVRTAAVSDQDIVLEVGAGAGFLTERLCAAAARVISVEIDEGLFGLASERLADFTNLTLIHADALAGERKWSAPVARGIDKALAELPGRPLKLVANLPYSIATAVIQVVLESDGRFEGAWFTCQKEVADRLTAKPGGDDYGFVSVLVTLLADIRVVRKLPPSVFWPRPKVDSAIVEVMGREAKRFAIADMDALRRGLSFLFTRRRKQLKASLKGLEVSDDRARRLGEALCKLGIRDDERVFKLTPEALKEIAEALF